MSDTNDIVERLESYAKQAEEHATIEPWIRSNIVPRAFLREAAQTIRDLRAENAILRAADYDALVSIPKRGEEPLPGQLTIEFPNG